MHARSSFVLAVLALTMAPSSIAQEDIRFSDKYNVELGKPYPVIDGTKRYFPAGESVICLKNDGGRWFVQKLSANGLDQVSMKQYEDFPEGMVEEYVGYFGERLMFFYSLWDKVKETEQLFYREVDITTGMFTGKAERILAIKGKVTGSMTSMGYMRFHVTDKFDFIFSADEERLVVQYARKREKGDERKTLDLSVAVFNNEMVLEWSGDLRMPYPSDRITIRDYTIDAKGDICIIALVYNGPEGGSDAPEHLQYEFLRCVGQGTSWDISPLSLGDRRLVSLSFFEAPDGTLKAAGFYRKNVEQTGADGVFVCSFDQSDGLDGLNFHEILTELINMYTHKKEVAKKEKEEAKGTDLGLTNMELSRIFTDDDGSMVLVGEKRFTTRECYTNSKGYTNCYTVWHANDLVVCDLDPQGALLWMRRIPKRMASRMPIGVSYQFMYGDGACHFVHFDNESNLEISASELPSYKGKDLIIADRIEEANGTLTREAILDPAEFKGVHLYQLAIDRLVRTSTGELLMEAYKKQKEDVLVRIAVRQ